MTAPSDIDNYDVGGLLDFIADIHSLIRVCQHHSQDDRPLDMIIMMWAAILIFSLMYIY
jgi:hypothetical protein